MAIGAQESGGTHLYLATAKLDRWRSSGRSAGPATEFTTAVICDPNGVGGCESICLLLETGLHSCVLIRTENFAFFWRLLLKIIAFLFCWWALMKMFDLFVASGFFALIATIILGYFFIRAIVGMLMGR